MSTEYRTLSQHQQEESQPEEALLKRLQTVLTPLPERLDAYADHRLVGTFIELVTAMVTFADPKRGLHLTKLGAVIKTGAQAPAGTKRIERFLHSKKWDADLMKGFLWEKATQKAEDLKGQGKQVLCIHDGSRLEKPESEQTAGMCAVLSSKAKRLRKKRKGVWNPPGGKPITVLGLEWTGVIVAGMEGPPQVAAMEYWSRKGEKATKQHEVEKRLLWKSICFLGNDVLHVFDRGYASKAWLEFWYALRVSFVTRWQGKHKFVDVDGN